MPGVLDELKRLLGGGTADPEAAASWRATYPAGSEQYPQQTVESALQQRAYDIATGEVGRRAMEDLTPLDVAMGFAGGGLGTRAPRPPGARGPRLSLTQALDDTLGGTPPPMGHNAPPAEYKFPQYAEQYPLTGPPTTKINEKGLPYLSKVNTPEANAFSKERLRIQKDMDANGFTPYFDPAQRYHVDPANYPPNVDTQAIVPEQQSHDRPAYGECRKRRGAGEIAGGLPARHRNAQHDRPVCDGPAREGVYRRAGASSGPQGVSGPLRDQHGGDNRRRRSDIELPDVRLRQLSARQRFTLAPRALYEMPYPIGGQFAMGNMTHAQEGV